MDAKFSRVALAMHKRKEEKGESRKRKKKEFFQSLPRYNSSSSCISLFLAAFSPFSPEESLRFLFLFPSLRTSHKPLLRIYMYIHIDTHIHTHTYIKFYLHRSALLDEKLEEKKREENHFDRLPWGETTNFFIQGSIVSEVFFLRWTRILHKKKTKKKKTKTKKKKIKKSREDILKLSRNC